MCTITDRVVTPPFKIIKEPVVPAKMPASTPRVAPQVAYKKVEPLETLSQSVPRSGTPDLLDKLDRLLHQPPPSSTADAVQTSPGKGVSPSHVANIDMSTIPCIVGATDHISPIKMPEPVLRIHRISTPEPVPVRIEKKLKWVTDATQRKINDNLLSPDPREIAECKTCKFRGARKSVRAHIRQHYTRAFCVCTHSNTSRNQIYDHQRRHGSTCERQIYEVDEESFPGFLAYMRWTSPPSWQPCIPTQTGGVRNQRRQPTPISTRLGPVVNLKRSHVTVSQDWDGFKIPRKEHTHVKSLVINTTNQHTSIEEDSSARGPAPLTTHRQPERRQVTTHGSGSTPLEAALGRRPTSARLLQRRREFQRQLLRQARQLEDEAEHLATREGRHLDTERRQLSKEARRYRKAYSKLD